MKNLLIYLFFLGLSNCAAAQSGYQIVGVSAGISSTNSKYVSITLEHPNNKKFHTGFLYETMFYSNNENKTLDISSNATYHGLGIFLSSTLTKKRNHETGFVMGGMAYSNFSTMAYSPFLGINQSCSISPKTQLFIATRISYLFNIDGQHWQPQLMGGLKFQL